MRDEELKNDLKKPEDLDKKGARAYEIITAFLKKHDLLDSGGCKTFYSPKEWKERGEEYGTESKLIIVYDGGDLPVAFNLDYAGPTYHLHTELDEKLRAAGLYAEECTNWYSAIYES